MRKPSDFLKVRVDSSKDMVNFSDEKKEKIEEETFATKYLFVDEEHAGKRR